MRYEYERSRGGKERGDVDILDTNELNVDLLIKEGLSEEEAIQASKAIALINSDSPDWKTNDGSHYRTRSELEKVSGETAVQQLISMGILELHRKWWRALRIEGIDDQGRIVIDPAVHKRHPQAPYRIDPGVAFTMLVED